MGSLKTFLSLITLTVALAPVASMAADETTDNEIIAEESAAIAASDEAAPAETTTETETLAATEPAREETIQVEAAHAAPAENEFATAMSNDELGEFRGGFISPTIMNSNMVASLENNAAVNTVSGNNNIGDGAFSNINGFANVIQNSGNNVIIQSSFQVNVNFND
jgi:hypothetical protein